MKRCKCGRWGYDYPCPVCLERTRKFEQDCEDVQAGEMRIVLVSKSQPRPYSYGWTALETIYKITLQDGREILLGYFKGSRGGGSWSKISPKVLEDWRSDFKEYDDSSPVRVGLCSIGYLAEGNERLLLTATDLEVIDRKHREVP